ncbi:hypothetical protein [Nocardia sp. NPDC052112]
MGAQDQLFDAIISLSVPGSRGAIEQMDRLPTAAAEQSLISPVTVVRP